MLPRILAVKYLRDFVLELTFTDGTVACLDFGKRIVGRGGVFAALQNSEYFAKVAVDAEAGTVVWPNGVDFCPDVLYGEAVGYDPATIEKAIQIAM